MGLFGLGKKKDTTPVVEINEGVAQADESALIMDVRFPTLYGKGHIPGSRNFPMTGVASWLTVLPKDKDAEIYVCGRDMDECKRAVKFLKKYFRFTNIKNMGGFGKYTGEIQEGMKPGNRIPKESL